MIDSLDSELDDNVSNVIGRAASGGTKNADAAIASLSASEAAPKVEIGPLPSSSDSSRPKTGKRRTRLELETALAEIEAANAAMREKLKEVAGESGEQAVKELGAVIAFAVSIAGRWNAARLNAPHWIFPKEEAAGIGEAWAIVAAPYAEELKEFIPLGLALAVTWQSLEPRLEADKVLAAEPADVTSVKTTGENGAS